MNVEGSNPFARSNPSSTTGSSSLRKGVSNRVLFGDLKEALLHFEYVIPANLTGDFMGLRPAGPAVEKYKEPGMTDYNEVNDFFSTPEAVAKLYPPHLAQEEGFKEAINVFEGMLFELMVKKTYGEQVYQEYRKTLSEVVTGNSLSTGLPFSPTAESLQYFFTKLTQILDCRTFRLTALISYSRTKK